MQGLPASGKSTRAKMIVAQGGFVRINKDLLRTMLHYDKFSGINEGLTHDAAQAIARRMLTGKHSVVIDDTNLNPRTVDSWKGLAKEVGATIEYERMATPVEECLKRDKGREKAVGRFVITNMALQYGLYPKPAKGLVLCDLDGTLFDITHRLQYAKGETKNWDKFFEGIPYDVVRTDVRDKILAYRSAGHEIIFVSARPERTRTTTWMKINAAFGLLGGFDEPDFYATLIMRRDNDKRDDTDVKKGFYDTYFKDKYPIEIVIDDRPKVIRMWRENGLNVMDVGGGVEF